VREVAPRTQLATRRISLRLVGRTLTERPLDSVRVLAGSMLRGRRNQEPSPDRVSMWICGYTGSLSPPSSGLAGRQIGSECAQPLAELTACAHRIEALTVVATDRKVNEGLQQQATRPAFQRLFQYFMALEELLIIEEPDSPPQSLVHDSGRKSAATSVLPQTAARCPGTLRSRCASGPPSSQMGSS
jgi:hypothetical protein